MSSSIFTLLVTAVVPAASLVQTGRWRHASASPLAARVPLPALAAAPPEEQDESLDDALQRWEAAQDERRKVWEAGKVPDGGYLAEVVAKLGGVTEDGESDDEDTAAPAGKRPRGRPPRGPRKRSRDRESADDAVRSAVARWQAAEESPRPREE
eukprot:736015-Prymnesium_polylepis.1